MKFQIRQLSVFLSLAFFVFAGSAYAQFENAALVGTIQDSTGAVIPGTMVTATNVATGVALSRTTDTSGEFQFPSLRVGVYRIEASKEGFQKGVANKINMSVGTTQRVNLTLQPGSSNETVTVEANELVLATETSQRGQIITPQSTDCLLKSESAVAAHAAISSARS